MLHYRPGSSRRAHPRWRLLALMLGAAGLSILLGAGLVLSVISWTGPHRSDRLPAGSGSSRSVRAVDAAEASARDQLAARAMPDTGTGHEYEWSQVSTRDPGPVIVLPPPRGSDGVGVGVGFPQTPVGALAQLAAIDTVALESGSLPRVRALVAQWAAPGGPTGQSWSMVASMASLLESTGVSGSGSPALRITAIPAMGLVKGQVGDDFIVGCVDFSLDVAVDGTSHPGASVDCQRMAWTGQRWVIGPGPQPAAADSVWPDTDAAIDAGFRDLSSS